MANPQAASGKSSGRIPLDDKNELRATIMSSVYWMVVFFVGICLIISNDSVDPSVMFLKFIIFIALSFGILIKIDKIEKRLDKGLDS